MTAVCATAHLDLVKDLGVDRVIDSTTTDFTKDDQTYDVVLDSVGKKLLQPVPASVEAGRNRHFLRAGPHAQSPFLALLDLLAPLQRGQRRSCSPSRSTINK